MKFCNTQIDEFLGINYFDARVVESDIEGFRAHLDKYKNALKTSQDKSENHISANILMPFLQSCNFEAQSQDEGVGNSQVDLVIKKDNKVCVIFELKKEGKLISNDDINCKALHEAILYYFRLREGNPYIRFIILGDFSEFYIFRAQEFEELFYKIKIF